MKAPADNQIVVTHWSMQVLGIGGGWTWILSNMKTLLETGEPMPQGY